MRTTLSLDDDVAAELDRLRRAKNLGMKTLVNEALRFGLREIGSPSVKKKPFRTKPIRAGRLLVPSIDNVWEVIAEVEGDAFR